MVARRWRRMVCVSVSTAVVGSVAVLSGLPSAIAAPAEAEPLSVAQPMAGAAAQPTARTSAKEARRVDRVKKPKLKWYTCVGQEKVQCATAKLPRDYDHPDGAKVEVALVRVKAKDQKRKIGSLFVNPGGPGGSGTQLAASAPGLFSAAVLQRFDIVGFDPRGTNFSDQVKCFKSPRQQSPVYRDLGSVPFPVTQAEEKKVVRGAKALGKACSKTGKPLSASMSTAEVARDMDVLRRAVGDKSLNYFGISYGSYLGQVYANLFPDRFRSLAIDGVLDPVAWAGTSKTQKTPVSDRIRSADGAAKALREILLRCQRAGTARCQLAAGNPVADFDLVAQRLKKKPVVLEDGGESATITYATFISLTLSVLYLSEGYLLIDQITTMLLELTAPPPVTATNSQRAAAVTQLRAGLKKVDRLRAEQRTLGFPYDNAIEASSAVLCTDSRNPADASSWPRYGAAADRRAKYFGRAWLWNSSRCATKTWTAKDEDAYRGPFTRRTKAPVLVVGSLWDPATNYAGAVKAASLLPNSRLLTSDNWGHAAFLTSTCATSSIENYLLTLTLPAKGARCVGDVQPFTQDLEQELGTSSRRQLLRGLVPQVPLVPSVGR